VSDNIMTKFHQTSSSAMVFFL